MWSLDVFRPYMSQIYETDLRHKVKDTSRRVAKASAEVLCTLEWVHCVVSPTLSIEVSIQVSLNQT